MGWGDLLVWQSVCVWCTSELFSYWLCILLQLLRAQKKAVKREQEVKVEAERRQLSMVLHLQHILHILQQDHIKRDLLQGNNQAPHVPAQQLNSLIQLATLLKVKMDNRLRCIFFSYLKCLYTQLFFNYYFKARFKQNIACLFEKLTVAILKKSLYILHRQLNIVILYALV